MALASRCHPAVCPAEASTAASAEPRRLPPPLPSLHAQPALASGIGIVGVFAGGASLGAACAATRRRRAGVVPRQPACACSNTASSEAAEVEAWSAALQLPPDCLRIAPPDEEARPRDAVSLTGDWMPLFRGSAPYISMFQGSIMVLHIPGRLFDPSARDEFDGLMGDIALCALLGVQPVLVLSLRERLVARLGGTGSDEGAEQLERLGVEIDSLTMEIVKQESGAACLEVESAMGRFGRTWADPTGNVSRLSSVPPAVYSSAQLITAAPAGKTARELLGKVVGVDVARIRDRLRLGHIVCLTPLAFSAAGEARYLPAEELAADVAKQLQAAKLIYFTQGQKIVDTRFNNQRVSTVQLRDAAAFAAAARADGRCEGRYAVEYLRYVELLASALRGGTRRGHLIGSSQGALLQELYTTDGSGTLISQDLYDGIRLATASDVAAILELTAPLVRQGLLRERSGYEVEGACNAREMFVWRRDEATIGCACIHRFEDAPDVAELNCFVVAEVCRGAGYGDVLLSYLERVASLQGIRELLVLTTQTMQWFVERGFTEASVDAMPPSKRRSYDASRSSRVYTKRLDALPSELQERFTFIEVDGLD